MKKTILIILTLISLSLFNCKKKKDDPSPSFSAPLENHIPYNIHSMQNRWWVKTSTKTFPIVDVVNYQSNGVVLDSSSTMIAPVKITNYSSEYYIDSIPNSNNTAWVARFNYYTTNQYSHDTIVSAQPVVTYYNGNDTLVIFDTIIYVSYKME